jgi:hypothetical protein
LGHLIWLVPITLLGIIVVKVMPKRSGNATHATSSTQNQHHDQSSHETATRSGNNVLATIGIIVGVVLLAFCFFWARSAWKNKTRVAVEPIRSCTTPCTLHRNINQVVNWQLGVPMKVRVRGENWILYPGIKKGVQDLPVKEFPPGWTDFDSPAGAIYVEIDDR